jgi:hypothetical protein
MVLEQTDTTRAPFKWSAPSLTKETHISWHMSVLEMPVQALLLAVAGCTLGTLVSTRV